MSDINDLIHSNARVAFDQGIKTERQRIIKLIEEAKVVNTDHKFFLIRAIKGEQK